MKLRYHFLISRVGLGKNSTFYKKSIVGFQKVSYGLFYLKTLDPEKFAEKNPVSAEKTNVKHVSLYWDGLK
jgi:hypothetical protein